MSMDFYFPCVWLLCVSERIFPNTPSQHLCWGVKDLSHCAWLSLAELMELVLPPQTPNTMTWLKAGAQLLQPYLSVSAIICLTPE